MERDFGRFFLSNCHTATASTEPRQPLGEAGHAASLDDHALEEVVSKVVTSPGCLEPCLPVMGPSGGTLAGGPAGNGAGPWAQPTARKSQGTGLYVSPVVSPCVACFEETSRHSAKADGRGSESAQSPARGCRFEGCLAAADAAAGAAIGGASCRLVETCAPAPPPKGEQPAAKPVALPPRVEHAGADASAGPLSPLTPRRGKAWPAGQGHLRLSSHEPKLRAGGAQGTPEGCWAGEGGGSLKHLEDFFKCERWERFVDEAAEEMARDAKLAASVSRLLCEPAPRCTTCRFLVQLPPSCTGVQHRKTKNFEDRLPTCAMHGMVVAGTLEDDEQGHTWLRLSIGAFLPLEVGQVQVLSPLGGPPESDEDESSVPPDVGEGLTLCGRRACGLRPDDGGELHFEAPPVPDEGPRDAPRSSPQRLFFEAEDAGCTAPAAVEKVPSSLLDHWASQAAGTAAARKTHPGAAPSAPVEPSVATSALASPASLLGWPSPMGMTASIFGAVVPGVGRHQESAWDQAQRAASLCASSSREECHETVIMEGPDEALATSGGSEGCEPGAGPAGLRERRTSSGSAPDQFGSAGAARQASYAQSADGTRRYSGMSSSDLPEAGTRKSSCLSSQEQEEAASELLSRVVDPFGEF